MAFEWLLKTLFFSGLLLSLSSDAMWLTALVVLRKAQRQNMGLRSGFTISILLSTLAVLQPYLPYI